MVQVHAEALLALATEHGFARYAALGALLRGWALSAQGQRAEGIDQMRRAWPPIGLREQRSACRVFLASSPRRMGRRVR